MIRDKSISKDKRRKRAYNIYQTQSFIWQKALDVSKQLLEKTTNARYVRAYNFEKYIKSMMGEIKSVEKHNYKSNSHYPSKRVTSMVQQFFNRIKNVYNDDSLYDEEKYRLIRTEMIELYSYCLKMNRKYSKLYHFKN